MRKSKQILPWLSLPALALLAACQTGGGNIFSDAAPKAEDVQQNQEVANVRPGENPNARRRQKNTSNALSKYCPVLRIQAGTESYREYKNNDRDNDDAVRFQATITKVARECAYVGQNLEITIGAKGRIITGPAGKSGTLRMPIRVAIKQGGCVRHFDLHQQSAEIAPGSTNTTFQFVDDKVIIPAPTSLNVEMFVGFDETPNAKPSAANCV